MKVISEDRNSFINIEFLEAETERYPSLKVSVIAENNDFRGVHKSCWIEKDELSNFINALKEIDTKRKGKAALLTMSPLDFILEFEVLDRSGHIKLKFSITKPGIYAYQEISLKGGFDIDGSEFTKIVLDFENLYKQIF